MQVLIFAILVISSILLLWLLFRKGEEREERRDSKSEERQEDGNTGEELYAKTPINKVDDYEFSRIFGYEEDGKMVVPPQDFNKIITERAFDWPDKPISSDARKPMGVVEGFTADGRLSSRSTKEAILGKRGEKREERHEERVVEHLVEEAYKDDPEFAPVLTKIGENRWEVAELVQRKRNEPKIYVEGSERESKRNGFFSSGNSWEDRVDPFFPSSGFMQGRSTRGDPFAGPVPNMERMFGPTFDHTDWIVKP